MALFISSGHAQDTIITNANDRISSKILEVTTSEIKYKKMDNLEGPLFSIFKSDVAKIIYANGTSDVFNQNTVVLDDGLLKTSREDPSSLTIRGNKVFVEIPDEASRAGEKYFLDALTEWGYWNIVTDKHQAHFIIVFDIDKKAMMDKSASVTLKTREGRVFKQSRSYTSSTTVFVGYNAFYAVAKKVVERYFKNEFH